MWLCVWGKDIEKKRYRDWLSGYGRDRIISKHRVLVIERVLERVRVGEDERYDVWERKLVGMIDRCETESVCERDRVDVFEIEKMYESYR